MTTAYIDDSRLQEKYKKLKKEIEKEEHIWVHI